MALAPRLFPFALALALVSSAAVAQAPAAPASLNALPPAMWS